jgi:methylmalonyl-CoA mutase
MSEVASSYPGSDATAWRNAVERALNRRHFETLVSTTYDGMEIQPLYPHATSESARALRQNPGPWKIVQRIDAPEPEAANAAARAELEGGADGLTLVIEGAPAARAFGISVASQTDLDQALAGIDLDLIPIRVDAGPRACELAESLAGIAEQRRLMSAALDVDFGHDPIGHLARTGAFTAAPETIGRKAANLSKILREKGFRGHFFLADSRPYHDAGAGEAQELAFVLATAVAYLRLLEASGIELEEARDEISFLLAADTDQFLTLAKFRALRRLWASVEQSCGLVPKAVRIHAETSFRMMTALDPWSNIFRTTIAAFAAGIGAADWITVLPFTLVLGLPDGLARRLARNAQLILIHEAGLAAVADPAAGSGAFERLTENLCTRAWGLFQEIERHGGIIESLEAGLHLAEIAATAAKRSAAIADGKRVIVGTTAYRDPAEVSVEAGVKAKMATFAPAGPAACTSAPLLAMRDAEPYEALPNS